MYNTEFLNIVATDTATSLDSFLNTGSTVFQWLLTNAGTVVNTVMEYPLLSVGTVVGLGFGAVRLYRALKH